MGNVPVFCLRTIYSGSFFFMNVNTYKHSYSKFSSFVKRKMKFFGHLYTSKVETKTYTNDFTTWCVRVCICYVGCWQNTSYTVNAACTQSLSGLAAATHHCTSTANCQRGIPGKRRPAAAPFSRPGEPSKRRWPRHAENFPGRDILLAKMGALAVTATSFLRPSSSRATDFLKNDVC